MIYDILEKFKKEYEGKGDSLILGSYTLKDGLYVKIGKDEKSEYFETKTVKKEKEFNKIDGVASDEVYRWFKEVDYNSSYLNSNKALFDKKIHNNNYLSLYFKIENSEYVKNKLRDHFLTLLSFKKFKDKNEKEILNRYESDIKSFSRKKDIVKKYLILKKYLDEIVEKAKELEIKNYIKLFFDEDLKLYREESNIYLSLKIFNDIKYNQNISEDIYGLSNANMGLNSKKPYLENKTRKVSIPFFIENYDALFTKKFFDWLKLQPYRDENNKSIDRYLDKEYFFIQKHSKNDEAEIKEFDYIPLRSDDIKKYFKSIYVKNYLKIYKSNEIVQDYEIKEIYQLEKNIDEVFYNKQLIFNYYKDAKDIKVSDFVSKELQKLIFITRYSMNNYFRKFDKSSFLSTIKKYGTAFVVEHVLKGWELKAKESLNLKFSIIENEKQKGEEKMDIEAIEIVIMKKLEESDYGKLNCEQFFYLSGQVVAYLLSKSQRTDKTHELVEPFLRSNNAQKIKKEIESVFFQYKHALYSNAKRVNNALTLIMAYEGNEKLVSNTDSFLVGYLSSTKIFKSNEGDK